MTRKSEHDYTNAAARELKWIPLLQAYGHVLGIVGSPAKADAELRQALDDGRLRHLVGYGKIEAPKPMEIINEPAPAGFWRAPTRVTWRDDWAVRLDFALGYFEAHRVVVEEGDLFELRPPKEERAVSRKSQAVGEPRKRGAPIQIDWDKVFGEVLVLVHEQGAPTNERAFAKKVCDRCSRAGLGRVPAERSVRDKLPVWFAALRRSMKD
jgi:hypothetical protein